METMTSKKRVQAALEGRPTDRLPVTLAYAQLYHEDHFAELTGCPWWDVHKWRHMCVDEHMKIYRQMIDIAPFDILQPQIGPSREDREKIEFAVKDGKPFMYDHRTGTWSELRMSAGHPREERPQETRWVWNRKDADEYIKKNDADTWFQSGGLDYAVETARQLGDEFFVLTGGVVGTLFSCSRHVGLTNLFAMLIEEADLIEYMEQKILENNIESIRALAKCGGDGIYIDDATASNDMISVAMYERFCLPYVKEMVNEIHRLGHKAILIYFGGIADRLEQIAYIGADGLIMETSMKNYVNDIGETVEKIGDRLTLFANIDPLLLEKASDEGLENEIKRQGAAGRKGRGFIMSTASPVTPETSLSRIRRFIELSRLIEHTCAGWAY